MEVPGPIGLIVMFSFGVMLGFLFCWVSICAGYCECMLGRHAYGCPRDGED